MALLAGWLSTRMSYARIAKGGEGLLMLSSPVKSVMGLASKLWYVWPVTRASDVLPLVASFVLLEATSVYSVSLLYSSRRPLLVPSCDFLKVEFGWCFRFLSLLQIRHLGPMIQQTQGMCASCKGQGRSIEPSKRCKTCGGKGVCKERKILQIFIEKGECECGHADVLRCAVGCRRPNSQTDMPTKLASSNTFGSVSVVFRLPCLCRCEESPQDCFQGRG